MIPAKFLIRNTFNQVVSCFIGIFVELFSGMCKIWGSTSIRHRRILHVVSLLLVGSVVYFNSFTVPFILDDHYSIDYFGKMGLLEHLLHGSSRRVADITFALNYRIHGLQVGGYHLTNLAIHLTTSILLYFMVVSAVSALRISFNTTGFIAENTRVVDQFIPFAIALLFAIHPVQTQAVTYIIQRYTSLATFFYLLSSLCFIRARIALERSGPCRSSWLLGAGSLVAGLLAVGSKQISVTLPLMLILLEIFLFRGRLINRRFFVACGVFSIIVLGIALFKWHDSSLNDFFFDVRHATSEDLYTTRTTYFLTQTRVVVTYLSLLCLPIGQSLVQDSPIYTSFFSPPVLASLALHIILFATAVLLFIRSGNNLMGNTWERGVFQRLASLGIIWFYIAMAVESTVFPIRDIIFEHRIYLPSAGFFMTITAVTALAVQGRRIGMKLAWALFVTVCLLMGSMTIARNRIWNDSLTLWQDAASKSPNKWLALTNLSSEYSARNMPEKALPLLMRAIELNPALFYKTKIGIGDTLKALNISGARFTTGQEFSLPGGDFNSGILDYKNLAKWEGVINNNMGLAYEYLKEPEKAVKAYKLAVTVNPSYDLAWYNLILLARRLGDKELVDEALERLQAVNPSLASSLISNPINGSTP